MNPDSSSTPSSKGLSSSDVSLSPRYVTARTLAWVPLFIVVAGVILVFLIVPTGEVSTSIIIGIIFGSLIYFSFVRWLVGVQRRNFYFECNRNGFETRKGFFNQTQVIVPYDQITRAWVLQEKAGGGRYSSGFPLGIYNVCIKTNSWPHAYGGFTEDDAQKIVDFIQNKTSQPSTLTSGTESSKIITEAEPLENKADAFGFMLHHPSTTILPLLVSLFFSAFAYLFNGRDISFGIYVCAVSSILFLGMSYRSVLNNIDSRRGRSAAPDTSKQQ